MCGCCWCNLTVVAAGSPCTSKWAYNMVRNGMCVKMLLVPVCVGGDRACPAPGHRTNTTSPRQEFHLR
jgi:hypothetical protein